MRPVERVRRQALAETGMDFGAFRPSPAVLMSQADADLGGRLIRDLLLALVAGLAIAVVLGTGSGLMGFTGVAAFGAILGGVLLGLGVASWMAAGRLRRRIPEEVDNVFRVAGEVAHDASEQIEDLAGSAELIVRGLVLVSALPAVARVVSRRFLVLAPVIRPLLEGLIGRILDRGMPVVIATMPDTAPRVREIATGIAASRDRVIGRVVILARWGTLPLRVMAMLAGMAGIAFLATGWIMGLA